MSNDDEQPAEHNEMNNHNELNVDNDDENEEEPWNCEAVSISNTELFTIKCIYGFEKSLNLEFDDVYDWSSLVDVIVKFVEMLQTFPSSLKSFSQVDRAWAKWIESNYDDLEHNTFAMRLPLDLINPKDGHLQFILAFQQFDDFEGEILFVISEKMRVKSLKEIAASVVVEHLEDEEDIDKLDLPTSLAEDLKKEFRDYCEDWTDARAYVYEGHPWEYDPDSSYDFEMDESMDNSLVYRLDVDSILLDTQAWRSSHHQM